MVISLKYGASDAGDFESKEKTYDLAARFIEEFRSLHRSILCIDLLGLDIGSDIIPQHEKTKAIRERCPEYIMDAAGIVEKLRGG